MTDILDRDATGILDAMAAGTLSAETLMGATLNRIAKVNGAINAIVGMPPRDVLMAQARDADRRERSGPLHGLPVAVKDLSAARGLPFTEGSPLFANRIARSDDGMVARMRAAGAIFIGKTNTPEFGLGSHSYNPVWGVTKNPYGADRTAGGSSGGAAAALACGMVALADGSDMMGSLRNPAAWCNVYGFRPSYGVVPSDTGGEAFLHGLSTAGPMARSPRDLALLASVQAAPNPSLPYCVEIDDWSLQDRANLDGVRIGWLCDWGGAIPFEAGITDLCEGALEVMRAAGAEVDHVAPPFDAEAIFQSWCTLRSWSMAADLATLCATEGAKPHLKPEAIWEMERGLAFSGQEIHAAGRVRSQWFAAAAELFDSYDALVLPTAQVWPFPATWDWPKNVAGHAMDSYHRWMEVVVPASLLGLPVVNVPVGFGDTGPQLGLPMGLQLIGRKGTDVNLLTLAETYHQATRWPQRHPPDIQGVLQDA